MKCFIYFGNLSKILHDTFTIFCDIAVYLCGVGLKDRRIPDSSFTASSSQPDVRPEFARHGSPNLLGGGAGFWACRSRECSVNSCNKQ